MSTQTWSRKQTPRRLDPSYDFYLLSVIAQCSNRRCNYRNWLAVCSDPQSDAVESTDLLCAHNCVESNDWAPPKLHLDGRPHEVLSFRGHFTQIVGDEVSIEFSNERVASGFTCNRRSIKTWGVKRVPKCWEVISYEATRASIVSRKPSMESAQATPTSLDEKPGLSSPLTYDGATIVSTGSPKIRHGKKCHE